MSLNLRRILSFVLIFLFIAANYCAPMVLAEESDALPAVGDVIFGFTVDSITQSNMLDSEMIAFTHEQSGARLLYIKNDDPEVAFSISYRTPYVDETDTNHIFSTLLSPLLKSIPAPTYSSTWSQEPTTPISMRRPIPHSPLIRSVR